MGTLDVWNVGQGDCITLYPESGCCLAPVKLLIDTGPGDVDITKQFSANDKTHIFLTHSHKDHIGGLALFTGNKMNQVEEITVPFYQNEIVLLAKSILELKGTLLSGISGSEINEIRDIVGAQMAIKNAASKGRPKLTFAYEGKPICNHVEILNPPLKIKVTDSLDEKDSKVLENTLEEIFQQDFAYAMQAYTHAKRNGQEDVDSPILNEITLHDADHENYTSISYLQRMKGNYVLNFLQSNLDLIRKFNSSYNKNQFLKLILNYKEHIHNTCIVMKASYSHSFLLTGDAGKSVLKRLIKEKKDISAEYLKVPHHGSKNNLNLSLIRYIHPDYAVISHDNRIFGRAKDSHPNIEVMDWLNGENISILSTNDILKDGKVILKGKAQRKGTAISV